MEHLEVLVRSLELVDALFEPLAAFTVPYIMVGVFLGLHDAN